MPSPSYLIRNQYSYCFRMNVPNDLQPMIGRKELRYSLKTGYLSKAKSKARRLAAGVQQLFQDLREDNPGLMRLSDKKIKEFVLRHLGKIKAVYDRPTLYDPEDPPPFENQTELQNYLDILDEVNEELRLQLAKGDYEHTMKEAKVLMQSLLPEGETFDETDEDFLKLCEGLMRAEIKGFEYHKARLMGKYNDDLDQSMEDVLLPTTSEIPIRPIDSEHIAEQPNTIHSEKKTSEVIPLFIDENKVKWTPKTESEVKASLDLFVEIMGDVLIQSVHRSNIAEYKNILRKLPPNKNKVKLIRGKSTKICFPGELFFENSAKPTIPVKGLLIYHRLERVR